MLVPLLASAILTRISRLSICWYATTLVSCTPASHVHDVHTISGCSASSFSASYFAIAPGVGLSHPNKGRGLVVVVAYLNL